MWPGDLWNTLLLEGPVEDGVGAKSLGRMQHSGLARSGPRSANPTALQAVLFRLYKKLGAEDQVIP